MRRRGRLRVSALDSGLGGPGSSPRRGHCVAFFGKTLTLTVLLFTQVYKWVPANVLGKPCDKLAFHPVGSRNTPSRFMLRKPELSTGSMGHLGPYKGFTRISVRCYFPRLDYQTLFRKWACANPQSHGCSPLHVNKMRRHGKRCISFSGSIWSPKGLLFTGSLLFYVSSFIFFFFWMLVFIALVDLRHRMDTLALSANISVYQSNTVLNSKCVNDPSRYFYFYSNSESKILIKKFQFSTSVCLYRTITRMRMFK